ncbi:MAG: efflux RND transporter periplasmic adaptor subunit [Rhodospirillaceae bacterium]|nr:efflux RND transporter periplasmic adaptor subunit [Rhodospirillaceae bacterium]
MMRFLRPLFVALVVLAAAGGAYYYYTAILNPVAETPAASTGPGGAMSPGTQASGRPQGAGTMPPGAARGGPPSGMAGGMGGAMGGGRPMPVVVARVTEEMFGERVEAIGTTFANESITVSAKVTGIIRKVDFDDGQYVEKGTEIVAIDAGEADARLNVELANLDEQRKELDRIQGLAKSNNVSQSRLDQQISALRKAEANVAAARARVADYRIDAPFAGVLGTRKVSVGALVSPGTVITTLDDISTIKLDFAVPENFLATLRPGLAIEATTTAYDNEVFKGEVVSVDSRVDVATRSVGIRAAIPNPNARLKPGMLMVVDLIKDNRLSLMIPEQAILPENTKTYVFVVGADNTAERVEVTTGRRRYGEVEILDGVAAGDLVIVEGTMDLRPRSKVEILNQDKIKQGPPSADMRGSLRSPG